MFCGNSSGKLGFLCVFWQPLLGAGLPLGKVSWAEPGAGLLSMGAGTAGDGRAACGCARVSGCALGMSGCAFGMSGACLPWWRPRHFRNLFFSRDSRL